MTRLLSAGVGALAAYLVVSAATRPWYRTWGATADESHAVLAGDSLIDAAVLQTTRATTVVAPIQNVWPWLVQLGQGRGGFYTYTWIENALRADIHNLDRIDPDLQHLEVGDRVRLTPDPYLGRVPGQYYSVYEIRPPEALVMLQRLPTGAVSTWSFTLSARGSGSTRLLMRTRSSRPGRVFLRLERALELLLLEPGYFVMERGVLRGLKRRAETSAAALRS